MRNGIVLRNRFNGESSFFDLNYKELQFAMDNTDGIFNSTSLLIDMIQDRLGFNFNIEYIPQGLVVHGLDREINCGFE